MSNDGLSKMERSLDEIAGSSYDEWEEKFVCPFCGESREEEHEMFVHLLAEHADEV